MITEEVSSLPSLPVLDKINRRQVNENFEEDAGGDEIAIPVCALGIVKGTTRKTHYTVRNMRNTFANIPRLLTSPLWLLIATCAATNSFTNNLHDNQGPRFMIEPTHRLEFMNRAGSRLDCTASGNPTPNVEWLDQDNNPVTTIPKVRHILANGSLYFPPFEAEAFRQDVHWTNYKCLATNAVGSIVSADVNIKAVVNQRYDPEVQNPSGFIGGNVVIRCNIPPFVKEHVSVTSWLQEPSFNIYPSLEGDGKYHMLPTGELLIINVTRNDANKKTFRCRTHHKLTQEAVVSSNAGRIQLSEIRESVPPIMNEKLIKLVANYEYIVVPCVAYANPKPIYRWQMKRNGREESLDELLNTGRATIRDGTLTIMSLKETDNGSYFCTATNSEGSETMEVQLVINTPLNVHITPPSQTIDLGKAAFFRCSVTGTPQSTITWLKDSQPLRTGARVRLLATDHIKITSTTKEDRGMYQCFATNDFNAVQATAELRLGEVAPHLTYKFIEQTMQPGPSVSLKCSATGNPTPQISWSLDGFPLPSNDRLMIGQYVTIFGDVISHVNISAVKSEDGGEYECAAKSISGSTSHSARLNVYVPPKITPFTFARDLNVGDRTSVQCVVVTGDLPLNFTWLKDDVPILTGGSASIRQNDEFTSALTILDVKKSDAGQYKCRVENSAASIEYQAELSVNVPPRISPFSFENDIMEGMRTQLMCSSSQGDQPLNITWFKGNRSIKTGLDDRSADEKSIDINEYSPFSSILTIHNVTSSHNGNYTCEISNRAATVSYTAVLSVSVPPRWIVEPQDQSVILGNLVIIDCKADGFPKPTVSWKQAIGDQSGEYRELSFATSFGIETHPNGSLIIPKVSKDHESNFLCQATNGIGAGLSKLIRLNVHVGPQVTVRNKLLSVRRGEKVTLICEAEGDEPLDISWRFKSHRIDPSYDVRYHIKSININQGLSSELTIIQTTLSDRGQYSCFASNAYGQHHSVIQLQVQEPPNFPRNLQINELASRTLILAWNPGDQDSLESQPVSNFVVQYKEAQDVWHSGNPQKVVPGDKTVALIGSLKPATNYHFRVYAENHLGTSAASDILTVQTDGEAPSGPPLQVTVEPLGRQQLIVTWRPPEHDLWNGELLGYTIGYRRMDSSDKTYNYTRVGIPGGEMINDFRLTGLEKYTQYSITVQAFNSKGDGPSSEPIVARTIEDVPSAPPQAVQCVALTAQSLQVSWQPPPKDHTHGIIRGYKIFYENDITRETKITSALNTVLHGLLPFTNYSVQVLAFTRTGEGVASSMVMCTTHQGSPDAPELIKAVVKNESSVIISWLPPRRSNGIITKYTIYIRILNKGQEIRILKDTLVSQYHYYEAKNLNNRETYEAWVTASTSIGEGPSTSVVKLTPNAIAPAAIISFGQTLSVAWKVDVKLPCLFVGSPLPSTEWRVDGQRLQKGQRLEVNSENSLILRSIQRTHEGNYTCHVRNNLGSDHIIFQLLVLVPPAPPQLSATASTTTSVSLQWHVGDNGGAPIRGFLLSFRQEFGDWEEIPLDRRSDSFIVEKLQCGTGYQFTLVAFNKIGNGNPSDIGSTRTKGNKPISPRKQHLIRVNSTTITLELSAWQDGGCPISHFAVEYRRRGHHLSREWILASSNVPPQMRYTIADLEPSLSYDLRVTAHNNAGTTVSEYSFETLSITGTVLSTSSDEIMESNEHYEFMDGHLIAIAIISIFAALIVVIGVVYCLKSNPRGLFGNNSDLQHPPDGKYMISEQRDQPYSTVRKSITQSPCRDSAVLDRIPEYSEDIYPYATFHLPDQENMSGNPDRPSSGCGASKCVRSTNTAGRRGKKPFKSESEEYDSLGSDTDTGSGEHGSRTESSNQLDDPINFCGRSYSPASKAGKEKFALFAKPSRHNGIHQFNNPEQNTSIERSPISKRTPQLLPLSQAYSAAAYCPTKDFNTLFTQYGHTRTSSYTEEGIFQHHYYNPQKLLSVKSIKSHSGVLESEFLTLTPKRRDRLLEQWQLDFRVMRNSSLDGIFNGATLSMDDAVNQFKAPNEAVKVPNINTTITDKTHIVAVDTPTKRQARHQQDYTIIV